MSRTATPPRRSSGRPGVEDGIVILSSENSRSERDAVGRGNVSSNAKRPSKGKPVVPPRKVEPTTPRSKLAGVTQNVNQHLTATSIEMTPLTAMPPAAALPSLGLNATPSLAPDTIGVAPRSITALALADPKRLREAFVLNEILQPPVSMRSRRIGPAPQ